MEISFTGWVWTLDFGLWTLDFGEILMFNFSAISRREGAVRDGLYSLLVGLLAAEELCDLMDVTLEGPIPILIGRSGIEDLSGGLLSVSALRAQPDRAGGSWVTVFCTESTDSTDTRSWGVRAEPTPGMR
ncbi:hypothetical protein H6P81_009748 [Aristolochia fimbriata]|uniref:Uncharacterized protein n=1 Tax=Aristolochia fimbriata TaxID=158543 RepID=A0AAV7ELR8_ARIFI|nr:hypothetical protein H6P81_009748 [Aristolochia fimbriata]